MTVGAQDARLEYIEDTLTENRKDITNHGQLLAVVVASMNRIEAFMKEQIEIQKEQIVLVEKFANHEERNADEHRHIHNRLDKIEHRCDNMEVSHNLSCDLVRPMAEKGASVHKILVKIAWGLAALIGLLLFSMVIWWIKTANYQP